ncbi:MAG: sulfatase-like hydrolase/transferase, partial [Bdellovibrionota bacterium]
MCKTKFPIAGAVLFLIVSGGCASVAPSAKNETRPRNVILISIDTLRADHLGAYGYPKGTSPNIDALARAGTVFEAARTNSTLTIQSHMSMLTGLLPTRHHVLDFQSSTETLAAEIPTLMQILQKNGFETFWFAGSNSPMLSGKLGYDRAETYFTQDEFTQKEGSAQISRWAEGKHEKPFFVFLHAWLSHSPYLTSEPYSSKFVSQDYKGRFLVDREEFDKELARTDLAKLNFPPSNHPLFSKPIWRGNFILSPTEKFYWSKLNFQHPEDLVRMKGAYDNTIFYTDSLLGELLAQLR